MNTRERSRRLTGGYDYLLLRGDAPHQGFVYFARRARPDLPSLAPYVLTSGALALVMGVLAFTVKGMMVIWAVAALIVMISIISFSRGRGVITGARKMIDVLGESWIDVDRLNAERGAPDASEYARRCWRYLDYLDGGGVRSSEVEKALDAWRTMDSRTIAQVQGQVDLMSASGGSVEALRMVAIDDDALDAYRGVA